MIRALYRKAVADLRSSPLQNALIFLILMFAALTLTVAIVIQRSADDPWTRTFEQANGAHLWVVSDNLSIDLQEMAALDGVEGVSERITAAKNIPMQYRGDQYDMYGYKMDNRPQIATPLLASGRWVDPEAEDEVVLDHSLAHHLGIEVGEQIDFVTPQGIIPFEVVGLAVSTHWFPYTDTVEDIVSGIAYYGSATFGRMGLSQEDLAMTFGIRLQNPSQENTNALASRLYTTPQYEVVSVLDYHYIADLTLLPSNLVVLFMGFFTLLGLAGVGVIIANSIGGQMLAQYREIGILKAIGFRPWQVMCLFLVENVGIALLAAGVGLGLGIFIAPFFTSSLAELLNTTPTRVTDPTIMLGVMLVISCAVAFFTWLPAWRAGRIDTVQAVSTGHIRQPKSASRLSVWARKLRLPISVVLGVKDVFARPIRAGFSIVGLFFTLTVVIFAVGADATLADLSANPMYYQGTPADLQINRNFFPLDETRAAVEDLLAVETYFAHRLIFGWSSQDINTPIAIRVLEGDYKSFDFRLQDGRMMQEPGEAIVGYGILHNFDAQLGDPFTFTLEGEQVTITPVGYYGEQYGVGNVIMFDRATYTELVPDAGAAQYFNLALEPGTDREALKERLVEASDGQFDVLVTSTDPAPSSIQLRNTARALSVLLLLIAGVNLLSNSLLGVQERARDFGIQKTIGFTPLQVMLGVTVSACTLMLIALVIGLPVGILTYFTWMGEIGKQMGFGPQFGAMNWWSLIYVGLLMFGIALLASLLPARRAAQVEVTQVLRYE